MANVGELFRDPNDPAFEQHPSHVSRAPEDGEFEVQPTHWEKAPMSLVICGIGNFLVWYDFNLIAFFADDLGDSFFPDESNIAQFTQVFVVYGIALMTQPIGGIVLGYVADRYGRRLSLQVSIIGMAISTFIIGIIPNYSVIGIWCIVLLIFSRIMQGICAGGEYGTVLIYITEIAPDTSLGKYIGILFASASGALLSLIAYLICQSIFTNDAIDDYIWRIPFLLSIVLGIVGVIFRQKMKESEVWQRLEMQELIIKNPCEKYLWNDNYFIVNFGVTFCASVVLQPVYYLNLIWLPSYFESSASNYKNPYSYEVTIASFIVLISSVMCFGYISDLPNIFDLKSQLSLFTFLTFFAYLLLYSLIFYFTDYIIISFLMILLSFVTAMDIAPYLIYVSKYIDEPQISASILSFAMASSNAIFAGTIDDIADAISDEMGENNYLTGLYIGLYVDLLLIISFIGQSIGQSLKLQDEITFGYSASNASNLIAKYNDNNNNNNSYRNQNNTNSINNNMRNRNNENDNDGYFNTDEETPLKSKRESFVDEIKHQQKLSQMESNLEKLKL